MTGAGALQRTGGALQGRYGALTHPENRREQQHPLGCVAAFIPIGQRTPFQRALGHPCKRLQVWGGALHVQASKNSEQQTCS